MRKPSNVERGLLDFRTPISSFPSTGEGQDGCATSRQKVWSTPLSNLSPVEAERIGFGQLNMQCWSPEYFGSAERQ
jgi:hypothetical protein